MTTDAKKPKTYMVSIDFKGFWPSVYGVVWNYTSLNEAMKHLDWAARRVRIQQGKNADRRRVIKGFMLEVLFRSKKRDKQYPPLEKFVRPRLGQIPKGGYNCFTGKIT